MSSVSHSSHGLASLPDKASPQAPVVYDNRRELDLAVIIVLAVIVCSILFPISFYSADNFRVVLNNIAPKGIVAIGMMMLMISGVFDLSVGSMMSMTGVICGWLMIQLKWPVPLAITAALSIAFLCGLFNGWLVAKARVNALIATLGALGVYKGVAVLIGGPGINNLPTQFTQLGQKELWGVQYPVFFLLALALLGHYLLQHTRYFRQYFFIGSNPKAARLSGIPVSNLQMLGFALSGLIAGLAGLVVAARFGAAISIAGDGMELEAISAVILGGASLSGGKGTTLGAMIGVLFMALVGNILIIARVPSYWQAIALGVILILAVAIDSWQSRGEKSI